MFIQANRPVVALENRDYPEWHRGRQHFALWYIEIEAPELIGYCQDMRMQLLDFLLPDSQRQFHISLFINGFLTPFKHDDDDFSLNQMLSQIEQLQQLNLQPFELDIGAINSFSSSVFLTIEDKSDSLTRIRNLLSSTQQEIAAPAYCPHITLGFYRQAFSGQDVLARLQQCDWQQQTIRVEQLRFGVYDAQVLQGRLSTLYQLDLVK
ncbi:2'-5' RNA ligase family protein [Acinetobacter puyangensis]|uniref:2'-5' RNA ligase family protein n=1 Tax=Acinetobacter puyangensis TaxID=1096779 RepID=UPI003A4D513B